RYIQDRFLPDKAIDLLDEAGSRMNLTIPYVDSEKIKERLDAAENLKQEALKNEDYEKAAYYRDQIEKYEKLKDHGFGYPHDSYIVNLKYLVYCTSKILKLKDIDNTFQIARSKTQEFNKLKEDFMLSKYREGVYNGE
ncbi:MAG: UvrB/UvrC motif-containing protein, partial [Clostridiales bacterium]|nr:UvrB/UvrC motif-containing protein [Clostridiales bacterium]